MAIGEAISISIAHWNWIYCHYFVVINGSFYYLYIVEDGLNGVETSDFVLIQNVKNVKIN